VYYEICRINKHYNIRYRTRWAEHAAGVGELRRTYTIFVEKAGGKRSLGRLGVHWRIILYQTYCKRVDWIQLDQDGFRWRDFVKRLINIQTA